MLVAVKAISFYCESVARSVRVDKVNEYPVELLSMREVASMWPISDDMHFTAFHHLMCA